MPLPDASGLRHGSIRATASLDSIQVVRPVRKVTICSTWGKEAEELREKSLCGQFHLAFRQVGKDLVPWSIPCTELVNEQHPQMLKAESLQQ